VCPFRRPTDGFQIGLDIIDPSRLHKMSHTLGYGHIPWTEIAAAVRKINYQGYVVMEPFLIPGGEVGRDIRVFRDLSVGMDLDEEARKALQFVRGVLK
jgi:D-psicose/D-tagatose/L-ribulose 3-epimerase